MCCLPTERRVSLLEARKTSDGTYPADPNVPPLLERATNSCPISRSDPCRIFLSDRLLDVHFVSPAPVGAGLVPAQPRATTRVAPTGGVFMKQTSGVPLTPLPGRVVQHQVVLAEPPPHVSGCSSGDLDFF